ncbi:MAG TPA: redoxin domain-containing protein [Gemmata sp.]
MIRLGLRLTAAVLPVLLIAGCGGEKSKTPKTNYKYNYGYNDEPVDLAAVAKEFLDDPPAAKTRTVAANQIPLMFLDVDGKPVDLSRFKGKANVVLVMTRGIPHSPGGVFCPGCLAQTNALVTNLAAFRKRNAEVLIVFPGPSDKASEFLTTAKARTAGTPSPVPLLLDQDMKAVAALNIEGDLAKPSTYILDRQGNVVYAYVGEHTTDRPSIKALLGQLDKMNEMK